MLLDFLIGFVLPPATAWFWVVIPPPLGIPASLFTNSWICSALADLLVSSLDSDWGMAACTALSLAIAAAIWWWRRRQRRKALRELGDKSRRRLAAILSSLRERAQPRPGLQPVPQGAR